jgi:plastocyanin
MTMRSTLTALVLASALLAGCGGNDNEKAAATATPAATATEAPASGSGGGGATIKVAAPADGSLKFDQSTLSAKAGKVTFDFSNPSSVPHAFSVEGNGVEETTDTVTGSDAPALTVDLKPGTYDYYCPVDGHRAAGMEGKLTVK